MNIKPVLRYQLRNYFEIFAKIYGVVYVLLIITIFLRYTYNSSGTASCTELTTMAGIFLVGLVLFKSPFRFFSSYGVSRKRLFCGLTATLGVTAAATAALDMINAAVFSRLLPYRTIYTAFFQNGPETGSGDLLLGRFQLPYHGIAAPLLLKNWLWCLLADFILGMLGLLIGVLYYRMGKTLKICVSVGVPAVIVALIQLDHNVAGGRIGTALTDFSTLWVNWGINPGLDLVTRLVPIALLAGCIWLLLRKAEVKAG